MNTEERNKIYEEVQAEIEKSYGEKVSLQEIDSIVQSQFKIMCYGFTKNIAITIPCFGKFIPIDKQYYEEQILEPNKALQQQLIDEGKVEEAKEAYINSLKKYKGMISEKRNAPALDADAVIAIVNSDEVPDTLNALKNLR